MQDNQTCLFALSAIASRISQARSIVEQIRSKLFADSLLRMVGEFKMAPAPDAKKMAAQLGRLQQRSVLEQIESFERDTLPLIDAYTNTPAASGNSGGSDEVRVQIIECRRLATLPTYDEVSYLSMINSLIKLDTAVIRAMRAAERGSSADLADLLSKVRSLEERRPSSRRTTPK